MFTGLVESLGRVVEAISEPPGLRLVVDAGPLAADAAIGDSICTSGCCLSVVRIGSAMGLAHSLAARGPSDAAPLA